MFQLPRRHGKRQSSGSRSMCSSKGMIDDAMASQPTARESATHPLGQSLFTSQKGCGCGKSGLAQPASSRNYSEERTCILQCVGLRRAIPAGQSGEVTLGSFSYVTASLLIWVESRLVLLRGLQAGEIANSHQRFPTAEEYTLPRWRVTRAQVPFAAWFP